MDRRIAAAVLIGLAPIAALAQPAPSGEAAPDQRGITRDQYVQRAADLAGRRFDQIDTAHAGVVTRDQIRAFRQAHAAPAGTPAQ